jgi:hypothetical protein
MASYILTVIGYPASDSAVAHQARVGTPAMALWGVWNSRLPHDLTTGLSYSVWLTTASRRLACGV